MKKNNWIDDVMNSADRVKPAEANPFLYEKILNRMQATESKEVVFTKRIILRLSLGFVLLLVLNLLSIKQYRSGRSGHLTQTSVLSEYDFSYNYNY